MSGKGALTQVRDTADCVSERHITTGVVQVFSAAMTMTQYTVIKKDFTADKASGYMTGFDSLFGYLLVTFCCMRHFQVELF